ncbi:phosphatases II [Peniophora sp. CONT]|nr:phosphatases II [Peniophora sp. CONT]
MLSPGSSTTPFDDQYQNKVNLIGRLVARRPMFAAGHCASQILPRLYLSDLGTASDYDTLSRIGITHIVSLLDWEPELLPPKANIKRLHIHLADRFDTDILTHLPNTTDFIRNALEESKSNKVLVHCMMGVSRSATVVCAYLISHHKMSAREAVTFTRDQRTVVRPNIGFAKQLEEYARQFPWGYAAPATSSKVAVRLRRLLEGRPPGETTTVTTSATATKLSSRTVSVSTITVLKP